MSLNEVNRLFNQINHVVNTIPLKVAVLAVNFSKERFVKKNWHDSTIEPWQKTNKRKGSTLVASGRLKQSIRKVRVSPNLVVIGTNVPYAQIHNEGGEIKGAENVRGYNRKGHKRKAHTRNGKRIKAHSVKGYRVKPYSRKYHRKFARRQFIGQSQELTSRIETLILHEIEHTLRQ